MKMKIISSLISVAALTAVTSSVYAAGTASGTTVNNTATISYKVGSIDQTDILSSPDGLTPTGAPTSFVVDKKIDLTVTENSDETVTPGQTAAPLTYDLTNTGNSTEYFKLTDTQVGSDDFDATATTCVITAAAPAVAGSGADTFQLAADATTTVTVSCDIPITPTNTQKSNVDLSATAVTDTTGATPHTESATDTADGVEVVLADANATATDSDTLDGAARNATHSAVNSYVVNTATLVVTKTSEVTEDPFNGTTNPKRIPGATIKYTIEVTNADGAADAAGLVITDILPIGTGAVDGATATTNGIEYVSCSSAGDATATVTCSESGGTVTTSAFTLPGGSGSASVQTLTIIATVK